MGGNAHEKPSGGPYLGGDLCKNHFSGGSVLKFIARSTFDCATSCELTLRMAPLPVPLAPLAQLPLPLPSLQTSEHQGCEGLSPSVRMTSQNNGHSHAASHSPAWAPPPRGSPTFASRAIPPAGAESENSAARLETGSPLNWLTNVDPD